MEHLWARQEWGQVSMACFEDTWAGGWPLLSPDVHICNIIPPLLLEGWTPIASSTVALLHLSVDPNLKASDWLHTVGRRGRGMGLWSQTGPLQA